MALAPWIAPAVLATYVHNIGVRLRREFRGHTRHPGDAAAIVRACIDACWNGRTFTASPGQLRGCFAKRTMPCRWPRCTSLAS